MATPRALRVAVRPALSKHTATIIFMHGLGDSSAGWEFISDHFASLSHVKFLFPNAPNQPVSINMGMKMPSWYDIKYLGDDATRPENQDRADDEGVLQSVADINAIIAKELEEVPDVPSERIVVGGFSQGCVVGLATGLTTERKLAGIVALSGYLAMPKKIASLATELGKSSPIFWGHGESDDVVKFSWAERSRDVLEKELQVKSLEFHSYRGVQHSASMEELSDLKAWLEKVLPAEAS